MGIKLFKPTSPGRRFMSGSTFEEITKSEPEKSLVVPLKKHSGRNNQGKVTVRHRGGGAKRMLRLIDFKRDKRHISGEVIAIEYDPNRSARIALVQYTDGEKRYIVAPAETKVGDVIMSGEEAVAKPGNTLPLTNMPMGTMIHNIELWPGQGGKLVRSAGGAARVMGREGTYTLIRLPSGEVRKIANTCMATVGQVGNLDHENIRIGKAGRTRHLGIRPTVRGTAMSPRDHPHGGGEGRCPAGMPSPKTPWGKCAKGAKTRAHRKASNRLIIRRRK